jgi:coenzyme F420-reducing hydrogenase delta subunit
VVPTSHVITTNVWNERCGLLQDDLSKQISSLKRQIAVNGEHLQARRHALLRFVRLAGHNPSLTADLLYEGKGGVSNRRGYFIKKPKVTCCHATSGGQQCNEQALLYSKYCLEHITCDKQQVLYQSCSVADNDTLTKCNKPIVELLQDKPYCYKHVSSGKSEVMS